MNKTVTRIISLVLVLIMCACGCVLADETASDENVITLQISEEAQKYAEQQAETNAAGKQILGEEHFDQLLASYYARTEDTFPECTVENTLDCQEFAGSKVYSLTNGENYENIVIYIHGGAWMGGIGTDHIAFCDALVGTLNAKVYMPLYPLAPQYTSTETYAMIEAFYQEVLKEGKTVYVMGDSAGGNITLGLLYAIKANGWEFPAKTVLLSPCPDMSMSNEAMVELNEIDPILNLYGCQKSAEIWAGAENLKDPKNSALYADLTGYPDIMIFQGTADILYADVQLLYEKLKTSGVNVKLVIGEGLWHVFPVDPIPEMDTALGLIKDFCQA